jgi:hypothetical protein
MEGSGVEKTLIGRKLNVEMIVSFEVDVEWQNTTQRSVPSPFKEESRVACDL